ncbi:Phosphatidylinositol:ceramide inositolphosphotransferase [Frankliniella fusca]|uniref:Phosphatidylinositol:ceramide inositolphosphotransferase n=1 Tax=Frankliniella fusca TaxID=407009 RepID=A0AAE1LTE1_9NEOP|nr:Phosphatidylinositol:ceramide inositolphosphotransferase [Frankliniella fusca]
MKVVKVTRNRLMKKEGETKRMTAVIAWCRIIIQSIFITASRAKTRIVIRSTKSSPGKYLYDLNLRVWISATFTVGNGAGCRQDELSSRFF